MCLGFLSSRIMHVSKFQNILSFRLVSQTVPRLNASAAKLDRLALARSKVNIEWLIYSSLRRYSVVSKSN